MRTQIKDTEDNVVATIEPGTEHAIIASLVKALDVFMVLDGEDITLSENRCHLSGALVIGRRTLKLLSVGPE